MLSKLRGLGFSESVLCWVFSYLTGRTQTVIDEEGGCSNILATSSGVSQSSVLGPLLFTLFINDICPYLEFSQHMIFADNTQIYRRCLPSELDSGIDSIAEDGGVISRYTLPTTASS